MGCLLRTGDLGDLRINTDWLVCLDTLEMLARVIAYQTSFRTKVLHHCACESRRTALTSRAIQRSNRVVHLCARKG